MNSIILYPEEVADNSVFLSSARWNEIRTKVHSDSFPVGILGAGTATASIIEKTEKGISLKLYNQRAPLPRLPITLIVGLSRPLTIRKVIGVASMMGVESLHFVGTEKGEKSYLQSTILKEPTLSQEIVKALEQSGDCIAPKITIHQNWRWFVKEKLASIVENKHQRILLDTTPTASAYKISPLISSVFCFGPEAGFEDEERKSLIEQGFCSVNFGERILRVEVAVAAALGSYIAS